MTLVILCVRLRPQIQVLFKEEVTSISKRSVTFSCDENWGSYSFSKFSKFPTEKVNFLEIAFSGYIRLMLHKHGKQGIRSASGFLSCLRRLEDDIWYFDQKQQFWLYLTVLHQRIFLSSQHEKLVRNGGLRCARVCHQKETNIWHTWQFQLVVLTNFGKILKNFKKKGTKQNLKPKFSKNLR